MEHCGDSKLQVRSSRAQGLTDVLKESLISSVWMHSPWNWKISLKIPSFSGGGINSPTTLPFPPLAINVEIPGPEKNVNERVLQQISFFTLAVSLFPPTLPNEFGGLGGRMTGVAANAPMLKSKNGEFGGILFKLFAGISSKFSTNFSIKKFSPVV